MSASDIQKLTGWSMGYISHIKRGNVGNNVGIRRAIEISRLIGLPVHRVIGWAFEDLCRQHGVDATVTVKPDKKDG